EGEALALPTGEVSGAAEAGSDDGVESVRQAAYCFLHSGNSQRRKDLLILARSTLMAHSDVVANAEMEVGGILEEDCFCAGGQWDCVTHLGHGARGAAGRGDGARERLCQRA